MHSPLPLVCLLRRQPEVQVLRVGRGGEGVLQPRTPASASSTGPARPLPSAGAGGRGGWLRPSTFGLCGWQLRLRPAQSQAPPRPAFPAPRQGSRPPSAQAPPTPGKAPPPRRPPRPRPALCSPCALAQPIRCSLQPRWRGGGIPCSEPFEAPGFIPFGDTHPFSKQCFSLHNLNVQNDRGIQTHPPAVTLNSFRPNLSLFVKAIDDYN